MLIPFQDRRASGRSGRPEDTGAVQLSHVTHTGAPGGWEDAFQKGTHKEQKYEQRHERRPPGPQCATAAGERLQRGNSPRAAPPISVNVRHGGVRRDFLIFFCHQFFLVQNMQY